MSEGIKAFSNYEWAWDNLPQEVQDALNADWIMLDEAKALVTEANNSLYGSQGYFHSLNGGAFDKYHLATGIEALKSSSRLLHASQARLSEAVKVLEEAAGKIDMQDVRLAVGEGKLTARDIINGVNAVLSMRRARSQAFLATIGEET